MSDERSEVDILLDAARRRGEAATGYALLPTGLDKFNAYVGLIGTALELGKLLSSEERDLKVIATHHEIEISRISAAFCEVEAAMIADFQRDESLKTKTFEAINLLIAAGQYEIASEFHKRLLDSFQRPSLEAIIDLRNVTASASGTRLRLR